MSVSRLLRQKIDLVSGQGAEAATTFWQHENFKALFPDFLFMVHSIIRGSVPIMEAALQQARTLPQDPVCPALVAYLEKHIPEEAHHDDWLLADMERFGMNREEVLKRMPSPTVAKLVGAQYYYIYHHHPLSVLGYIAVLENAPMDPAYLDEIAERNAIPRECLDTLYKHAELDPGHKADLDRFIDSLNLNKDQAGLIGTSAMFTATHYGQALAEIL